MDPIIWAVLLMALGLTTAIVELFIPTGGILGLVSLGSLLVSVWLAFREGPWVGLGFLAFAVIAVPGALAMALRWWPQTPMGRRLLLEAPAADQVLPDSARRRELKSLLGEIGETKSWMTPSGAVEIRGRVINALSEGLALEPGRRVRVVEVRGGRVVIRPVTEEPEVKRASDDPLSESIESIGLDPFDDPLA
ncbi:MAG TPA: NfeD family protein, partial [Pirellulales bacterium]|jgi:membrane-bound ClpP family serine protease|nr:NfeD family protein [Pirellulales bacterium]